MAGEIGLLVVHGIGAQKPGETLDKLVRGLRLVERDIATRADRGSVAAVIGGQRVRLYEVYWADLLMGEKVRGSFMIKELQSVSWFPFLNSRRGNYRAARHSVVKVAWWSIVLPIINFFVLFAYYGADFFSQIVEGTARNKPRAGHKPRTAVDKILDEYAGDVVNYVNSAGEAFFREKDEQPVPVDVQTAFPKIVQRFYDQLLKARADGCDRIQVVAHSLGTVVAYHGLSEFGLDPRRPDVGLIRAAAASIDRLYTIGSPLEKIRFFWPRIAPLAPASGDTKLRWDNFVSFFDPVSGMLRTFQNWGAVSNHRLLGGGFVLGHVVYEHSPVFLGTLTEGLCGRRLAVERSLKRRLWDYLVLAGETLFAPAALAAVLAVGGAFYVAVALLLPFLFSLMVRWFVPPETWAPIVDTASLVFLAMMTLTFLVAPAIRGSKVHRLYWRNTPLETPTPERTAS